MSQQITEQRNIESTKAELERAFVLAECADEGAFGVPDAREAVVRAGDKVRARRVPVERGHVLVAWHLGAAARYAVAQHLLRHRQALPAGRVARAQTPDARRGIA